MRIDFLANHQHLTDEVARLIYGQWAEHFGAGGMKKAGLREMLAARSVTDRLPITLVALEGNILAGTGSIKLFEPDTKPGLTPWLAGMYVKDSFRGVGVGSMLVRALEAKAAEFGVDTLYLSVGGAPGFYERLGWTELERMRSLASKEVVLMAKHLDTASPNRGILSPTNPPAGTRDSGVQNAHSIDARGGTA